MRASRALCALGVTAVMAVAATGAGARDRAVAASTWAWRGAPTDVMRSGTLDHGEFIYTNTLWLAKGANADGLEREDYFADFAPDDPGQMTGDLRRALTVEFFGLGRSVTNGDYTLPDDHATWPDGTGELSQLRLAADSTHLYLRLRYLSFPRPTAQIATLAFAAPGTTAATAWPANAKLASPYDVALTVSGNGAVSTGGPSYPVTIGDHTVDVRVPLADLPAGPWTLTGGSGLADPADPARYWTVPPGAQTDDAPGSGGPVSPTNVWGLLFAADPAWTFDELRQSRLLSSGVATGASVLVDPEDLQHKVSKVAAVAHGDVPRVYDSGFDRGDGIQRSAGAVPAPEVPAGVVVGQDFNVTYKRTGRQQDYAMRVPAAYSPGRAWPLIVYLHGFGGNPEEPFRLPLGLVDEAEQRGYLFASLQGRGDLFYRPGLGELDVVEALADIRRRYDVDPDRIYLMGHSMGGYGTNNVAAHRPDVFAAVAPAEGTDSVRLAPNLRHVPWLMVTADFDLDAMGANAEAHYADISALGYDATLLRYRLKIHEYSSIYDTLPRLFDFFAAHRRVGNPAVVTWVAPTDDAPEFGMVHHGAYWVSGVTKGSVTARSHALALRPGDGGPADADRAVVDPSDEGGPTGRTIAILRTTRPRQPTAAPRQNKLTLTVTGAPVVRSTCRGPASSRTA